MKKKNYSFSIWFFLIEVGVFSSHTPCTFQHHEDRFLAVLKCRRRVEAGARAQHSHVHALTNQLLSYVCAHYTRWYVSTTASPSLPHFCFVYLVCTCERRRRPRL